jgi:hypothetical protein
MGNILERARSGDVEGARRQLNAGSNIYGLTESMESGGNPNAVNVSDRNGPSFGSLQINNPNMPAYVKFALERTTDPATKALFENFLQADTATRISMWEQQGKILDAYSRDYIKSSHYDPALKNLPTALQEAVGGDIHMQQALMSTAVQHGSGGAARLFQKAWEQAGGDGKQFYDQLYALRKNDFPSLPEAQRAQVQRRLDRELNTLKGYANLSPERQKLRAQTAQQVEEINENNIIADNQRQMLAGAGLPDIYARFAQLVATGQITPERAQRINQAAEILDSILGQNEAKEIKERTEAGLREVVQALGSGQADLPAIIQNSSLPIGTRKQLLEIVSQSPGREANAGSREYSRVSRDATIAIWGGEITSIQQLLEFGAVRDTLSMQEINRLVGVMDERQRDASSGEDYVKFYSAPFEKDERRLLEKIALDMLAAQGLSPKSSEAETLMKWLTAKDEQAGGWGTKYNFQTQNRAQAIRIMRETDVLLGRRKPNEEEFQSILTSKGIRDTTANRERLNDAIRIMNDPNNSAPVAFADAWKAALPDFAYGLTGRGMITVPVGHNVTRHGEAIRKISLENGLDPNLVASLVYVASKGDPQYSNEQGGVGLMGFDPRNAQEGTAPELKDPQGSLEAGTALFSSLWRMNAGAGGNNRLETAVIRYLALNGIKDREQIAEMTSEILALYNGAPSEAPVNEDEEDYPENYDWIGLPLIDGDSVK